MKELDHEHYYAPRLLFGNGQQSPVETYVSHPPGTHPKSCIKPEYCALECRLTNGAVRWFGCRDAYINAELKMVVVGVNPRDEVMSRFRKVPATLRNY